MTGLITHHVDDDFDDAMSSGLRRFPAWILAGQFGVVFAVVWGFGARAGLPPKAVILVLAMSCAAAIVLAPIHRWRRIVVSVPLAALLGWWFASYLWTTNTFGWWADSEKALPYVVAMVVLAGILPARAFTTAIAVACYAAIALVVLELVIRPGTATINTDGVPGWRGSFLHKNLMGPFMVFAILALASFDKPSLRRRVAMGTAAFLVVMSQSASALSAGLVTLLVYLLLKRIAVGTRPTRAVLGIGAVGAVLLAIATSSVLFSTLLGLQGKDTTLSRRTHVWNAVVPVIQEQPLRGYGIGGVWSNPAVDPGRSIMRYLGFTVFHAHNGLYEILLLLGVVGLVLYLWVVVAAVRLAAVNLRTETSTSAFVVGFVVLLVMLSISEVVVFGIWLALLAGFSTVLMRADARRRSLSDSLGGGGPGADSTTSLSTRRV